MGDARAKLHTLSDVAERFSDRFVRVESITQGDGGTLRVLDLRDPDVRATLKTFD